MGDEQCVQAQLRSATAREARSSCASAGARLVEVVVDPETGTTLLEDLGHLLNV